MQWFLIGDELRPTFAGHRVVRFRDGAPPYAIKTTKFGSKDPITSR
jgi:hypothetical protein